MAAMYRQGPYTQKSRQRPLRMKADVYRLRRALIELAPVLRPASINSGEPIGGVPYPVSPGIPGQPSFKQISPRGLDNRALRLLHFELTTSQPLPPICLKPTDTAGISLAQRNFHRERLTEITVNLAYGLLQCICTRRSTHQKVHERPGDGIVSTSVYVIPVGSID